MIDQGTDPTKPAPAVLTGAQWAAAQSAPSSALLEDDPGKASTTGFGRALTGEEWAKAQRMTSDQVKQWKIPALPVPAAPRDVTKTPLDARTKGKQIETPVVGAIMRQLVDPVLEHPFASTAIAAAPFALPGVLGTAAALGVAGAGVHHIAQYGWQKLAESQLDPETRKLAEADPERISGEAAAVQAIMLGLAPLVHVGVRSIARAGDVSAGMMEAGVQGVKETNLAPRFSEGFGDAAARSRFAAQLEAGAQAATPTKVLTPNAPKGFEPTAARVPAARGVKQAEGLVVPETVKPGRVERIETEPANASLEDVAVRRYESRRVAQDEQDIAAQRTADAERVLGLREDVPEPGRVRRRPGGVKPEPATYFETPQGAEVLGAMAARHGMPTEANPYHPNSALAPEWTAGHQSATESYPLYPEGFAMGGVEGRIPPGYKPPRVQGFDPTSLPEGITPENAEFAAALRPSRFRGHTVDELVAEARDARDTLERSQTALDENLDRGGETVRDEKGNLRRNLSFVATDELTTEWQRLAELNANEEASHAAVQEAGYRGDYYELPKTERVGHKGKEDLPDADGTVDPERLLADNKIVADYNRNAPVRAARAKAIERIQRELDGRGDATSFEFGANASEGAAEGARGPTMHERAITRAKGTLTQVEREFALRGLTGDKLAELMNAEATDATASGEAAAVEGTAATRNAVHATREAQDLTNTLRTERERRSLERERNTDVLTGLGNQRAYQEALAQAEADPNVRLVRFDVNGMKAANDELGHVAGDALIKRAADAVRSSAPDAAVFRSGIGDEITAIVRGASPEESEAAATAIRNAAEEAYGVPEHGEGIRTSLSGGVGATEAEAEAAVSPRKAEHKAAQGIAGRNGQPVRAPSQVEVGDAAAAPDGQAVAAPSGALRTVEGTGETRTRGLSAGVEQKALANHLELTVGDLPEYRTVRMADQASRASALLAQDPDLAIRVATGEAPAPRGLLPESVFVAVERRAIADGDVNTLRDLATGRLTSEATTMGQRIRALGERDPESPVSAIQEIVKTRSGGAKNAERASLAAEKEVSAINEHLEAIPVDVGAWDAFLATLKC